MVGQHTDGHGDDSKDEDRVMGVSCGGDQKEGTGVLQGKAMVTCCLRCCWARVSCCLLLVHGDICQKNRVCQRYVSCDCSDREVNVCGSCRPGLLLLHISSVQVVQGTNDKDILLASMVLVPAVVMLILYDHDLGCPPANLKERLADDPATCLQTAV